MKQFTIFDCIFALRSYILEVLPRLVGWWLNTPNFKKIMGCWKMFLDYCQCQKSVDNGSLVS